MGFRNMQEKLENEYCAIWTMADDSSRFNKNLTQHKVHLWNHSVGRYMERMNIVYKPLHIFVSCICQQRPNFFMYSKVSIKRPVLLNNQVHLRKKFIVLFDFRAVTANFRCLIKQPGLYIWEKSLLNDQNYLLFKF